ncbi:MAG: hypothetical protein ABI533_05755, partial [Betaproteobacteria bacterium]
MLTPVAQGHGADAQEKALGSLVDAELAFARMGRQRGIREAFLTSFAEDGIAFDPAPYRLRERWGRRPADTDPHAIALDWSPAQAGIARSLDLGYTTGPFTLSLAAKPADVTHGVFFSVWQRRRGKPWRVVLDAGITTPSPVDFAAFGAAPRPRFNGRAGGIAERRRLLAAESEALGNGAAGITPNVYGRHLARDVRLHRDGALPVVSRHDVAASAAHRMSRTAWTPAGARVSTAG